MKMLRVLMGVALAAAVRASSDSWSEDLVDDDEMESGSWGGDLVDDDEMTAPPEPEPEPEEEEDCAASVDDLEAEEVEMMQAISDACAEQMLPCLGEGNTMVDFQLCDRPESACYDAVDACTEVEDNNSTFVDTAECTGAGDCEVVEMDGMVTCAPAEGTAGRATWECVMSTWMDMMAPPECTSDADCHTSATCVEEECDCNSGFLGDGVNTCIEVALPADVCVENEYASRGECLPCPAGSTSAAMTDTDADAGDTTCTATLCEANERVLANQCVACPAGTESVKGADASGVNTQCTDIPTTGMCQGNTDSKTDVTCGDGFLLKPDPETVEGTTTDACCDELPDETEDPPEVSYAWEATAWGVCEFKCGDRDSLTRTVKCMELTIYSTGAVTRAEASAEDCEGDGPATTQACPTLAVGTVCDDGLDATTGDACNADGECEGKQVLKSKLVFAVDTASIDLPPADASPEEVAASPAAVALAGSIKDSLVESLGDGINVVILSIQAGSLVVDYNVEIPAEVEVTDDVKEAAAADIADAAPPELPAEGGGTVTMPAPYVEPFKSYSYSRTAGCTPGAGCSTACGYEGEVAADVYTCLEDGQPVAAVSCVDAGIGDVPQSETVCCPPADDAACVASAAQVTAPPPPAELDCTAEDLTTTEKVECKIKEKTDAPIAVIAIVAVVVVLIAVYAACKCCKSDDEKDAGTAGTAGTDEERREALEKRLAKVKGALGDEENP